MFLNIKCVNMKNLLVLLLAVVSICACTSDDDKGEGDGNQLEKKLSFLDIQDASYLYIDAPEQKIKSVAGAKSTLFKITTEGVVKEVTYKDEEGYEYQNVLSPTNIMNVSDEYLIVVFDRENYLIRKSDGAAYLLPLQQEEKSFAAIDSKITLDSKGSMYFIVKENYNGQRFIAKIDISDPKKLTYEKLTPSHHQPVSFLLDKENNLFYSEQIASGGSSDAGEIYVLSKGVTYKTYSYSFWKGVDGYCYIYVDNFEDNYDSKFEYDSSLKQGRYVYKVKVTDIGLTRELFLFDGGEYWYALGNKRYYIGNKLYAINFSYKYSDKCQVFDISDKENLASAIYSQPHTFIPSYTDNKYIYSIPKEEDFYRFDPTIGEFKKIYSYNADYEQYGDYKVKNGIITFTAYQLSRNKNFMIEVDSSTGGNRMVELQGESKCVVLEKIK